MPQDGDRVTVRYADGTAWIVGTPVKCRYEYYQEHAGMPTGLSLFVWLPQKRAQWLEDYDERMRRVRAEWATI